MERRCYGHTIQLHALPRSVVTLRPRVHVAWQLANAQTWRVVSQELGQT